MNFVAPPHSPWHARLTDFQARARQRLAWPTAQELHALREAAAQQLRQVSGQVAVVPMRGVIEQRCGEYGYFFGGCSTEQLGECLERLCADAGVECVVLDIDSPGGIVQGTEELADKIFQLKTVKPIYGVANSLCASAAYWIASQCSEVICTPSGDVGSIGVYACHVDFSEADKKNGVKATLISAGDYKTEGNEYEPLTDEARAYMQEVVDKTYAKFCMAVARGRGVAAEAVKTGFGRGRVLMAADAKKAGLIDRIMPLDALLQSLGGQAAVYGGSRMMGKARQRAEHERQRVKDALALGLPLID